VTGSPQHVFLGQRTGRDSAELENSVNLKYNYFRNYDSTLGRYVESDPIGIGGGVNTYTYVRSRPTKRVDPTGLCDQCDMSGAQAQGDTIAEVARRMIARYLTASVVSGVEYCAWICQTPDLQSFFSMPAQRAPVEGLSGSCQIYLLTPCPECSIRRALWHTHYPDAEGPGEGLSGGDRQAAQNLTTGRVGAAGTVSQPTAQGIIVFAGSPSRRVDWYNGINGARSPVLSPRLRPGEGVNRTNY
jgi:RHS repeat-associated protein